MSITVPAFAAKAISIITSPGAIAVYSGAGAILSGVGVNKANEAVKAANSAAAYGKAACQKIDALSEMLCDNVASYDDVEAMFTKYATQQTSTPPATPSVAAPAAAPTAQPTTDQKVDMLCNLVARFIQGRTEETQQREETPATPPAVTPATAPTAAPAEEYVTKAELIAAIEGNNTTLLAGVKDLILKKADAAADESTPAPTGKPKK